MATNRFSLIIAVTVIAALAVLTISMATAARPSSYSRAYDQVELIRAQRYAAAAAQQAYLDQRHGEQTTGHLVDAQQAYLSFREGEWNAWRLDSAAQAYLNYRRGEWSGK
jgi:hypothetical protein